ncbi:hypothetical protein [Streptomyces sp. NPDC046942]|uniref:hypothetical protein n=1 Tax=Streptomyces sp. NPDC046942 TaxID=3155137 RepID=UPI0033C87F80
MSDAIGLQADDELGMPLPLERGRPTKRRAFLGHFAAAFYDEANPHKVDGRDVPNAVLENATGLMLCYDELWFLNRRQCPADMQDLDFVKFVSDHDDMKRTADEVLQEGFHQAARRITWDIIPPEQYRRYLEECGVQARRHGYLKDHMAKALEGAGYTASLRHAYESLGRFGKAPTRRRPLPGMPPIDVDARARDELVQKAEWLVADALQLGPMDYIANTGSSILLDPLSPDVPDDDVQFDTHKLEAIERVLHLRSTDALTPKGAYHEFITDLRKDKRITDLRNFLAGRPSPNGGATELFEEVEHLIATHQREALRRQHRPALLRTLGTMTLGAAVNHLLPGFGGAIGALINVNRTISDYKFRKNTQWALFVIDTRERQDGVEGN